ncbi:NAD-dependent epimerase/dehydratase family protein [Dickeya zeae]|uniref:NAD-dependent epimerase/dehydratase family protein n=1 Tax=Dickeya zeae TaxID=204042 RepID=UPI00143FC648|nr:NAD(P)-dependent oxidoreductase [Dickeya zeae]QIZ46006.1 NAD(P)-dependent oxidoreductase [Dickeya zeae]
MRITVTGANGFIGRRVVDSLINDGHEVSCFLLPKEEPHTLISSAKIIHANVFELTQDAVNSLLDKSDVLLHLAWTSGFNHHAPSHIHDVLKHYCFIEKVANAGVPFISAAGTMHEIGYHVGPVNSTTPCNPINPYGIAKNFLRQAIGELSLRNKFKFQWLRFYYITGDDAFNNSIFSKILEADKRGDLTFPLNSGEMLYDFIDVNELSKKIAKSITSGDAGIFNCSSGKPVSLKTKVESFIRDNNLNIKPEYNVYPARPYDSMAIWGEQ